MSQVINARWSMTHNHKSDNWDKLAELSQNAAQFDLTFARILYLEVKIIFERIRYLIDRIWSDTNPIYKCKKVCCRIKNEWPRYRCWRCILSHVSYAHKHIGCWVLLIIVAVMMTQGRLQKKVFKILRKELWLAVFEKSYVHEKKCFRFFVTQRRSWVFF